MDEDNRELYAAYRRAHSGGRTDAYSRYWPFMSEDAKQWYLNHSEE